MLTCSHAGTLTWVTLDIMLTCCHAVMPQSGHAVALTCWQTPERVPEQVCWFLLVVALLCLRTWAHDSHDMCHANVLPCMLAWHIEQVHTSEDGIVWQTNTTLIGELVGAIAT